MLIVVLPCTTINSEFWQAKMSLLTGCQWFSAESSLCTNSKLKNVHGCTFFNDAVRGGIENVPRIGVTVITKTGKSSLFPIL